MRESYHADSRAGFLEAAARQLPVGSVVWPPRCAIVAPTTRGVPLRHEEHLSLAVDHLARAKRSSSLGLQWEENWRALEQAVYHQYPTTAREDVARLLRVWVWDLPPAESRLLVTGNAIEALDRVASKIEPQGRAHRSDNRSDKYMRARRQGVPQDVLFEALELCRIVRNGVTHGDRVSTRSPDKDVLIGTIPILTAVAEAAVRLARGH